MKKFYFILVAAVSVALTSCMNDDFVGDSTGTPEDATGAIKFGFDFQKYTRGEIAGEEAARLLGSNFYVTGTKGEEKTTNPSENLVFDNYLVNFTANTAGTTESNTANWEYVGVTPGTAPYANWAKLSSLNTQTIKYWDYSTDQYDFLAFSTGTFKAVATTSGAADEIGVTAMKYGADLANSATAYTFDLPSIAALKDAYISDITEVKKDNYGKEVTLKFKNLGSKVRVALYETVPGYSVQAGSVKFYTVDGGRTTINNATDQVTSVALISTDKSSFASKGKINVYFPNVGTNNESNANYDKAAAAVDATSVDGEKYKTFGILAADKYATAEVDEAAGSLYLGRSLPTATFAGSKDAAYYETVFPVTTGYPLTLRVDYTLVSTDGSGETITVYGAKAVVPSTYTVWQPNYAYTYIFKITDASNGWTNPDGSVTTPDEGLFPITFDAVVTEATDATDEQTTITTVAAPSITTYQQGHTYTTNEYSKSQKAGGDKTNVKDLYVQVMDNSGATATPVTSLSSTNSLLYLVSDANATEAKVMDALEKRTTAIDADNVTGRNGISLTKNTNIANDVESIVNGVDDNPITVAKNSTAKIAIATLDAGTYAYVYNYVAATTAGTITEYQPINVSGGTVGTSGSTYYSIAATALAALAATPANITVADEAVNNDYIYFSITTNGTSTTTYSYVSVAGKTNVSAGLLKVAKTTIEGSTVTGGSTPAANTFYFDKYISNNGKYAVKVIKVVD